MNKFYFTLILFQVLCLSCTFSQNQKFEFFIGLNNSFRELQYANNEKHQFEEGDTRVLSANFGFRYNVLKDRSLNLKAGLDLTAYGFMDRKITDVKWPSEISPEGYKFDPNLPHELQNGRKFIYVELPIVAMLNKSFGKWTPNLQLEIIPQYLISYKMISKTDLGNTSNVQSPPEKFNKLNIAIGATIGSYYRLYPKISIFVIGFYRHQLFDIIAAPITAKLYGLGINTGVAFDIH